MKAAGTGSWQSQKILVGFNLHIYIVYTRSELESMWHITVHQTELQIINSASRNITVMLPGLKN